MRERSSDLLLTLLSIESDQPRGVAQIVGGAEIVVEADLVGQISHTALDLQRLALRVVAEHPGLSSGNVAQPEQHQDGGCLAGAIRAEQAEDFPACHRERDALDDSIAVVAL